MTSPTDFRHKPVTEENVLQWVKEFAGSSMWLAVTDFDAYSNHVHEVLTRLRDKGQIVSRFERGFVCYYPAEDVQS